MAAPTTGTDPAGVALARGALAHGMAALTDRDGTSALRWLDRAHRLAPKDSNIALTLASACLATSPRLAASLFAGIAEKNDVKQAWLGLITVRMRLGEPAAELLAILLSRHAFTPDTAKLADEVAAGSGWCGLRTDGTLEIHTTAKARVTLDGRPVHGGKLPKGWPRARLAEVRCGDTHLLGSPIQLHAIRRLAGCVEALEGGLRGWAWHPADPDTSPVLTLTYADGQQQTIVAQDESVSVADTGPLARPRSFHLTRNRLLHAAGPIHVFGPDGNDLPGSPLDPFADEAANVAAAQGLARAYPAVRARASQFAGAVLRADAPLPARPVGADTVRRAATVVIPLRDGGSVVLDCLASVLASLPEGGRILAVDDGSSDPALIAALDGLVRQRRISLVRHERAEGFPASANLGIRTAQGRDVVLLNSDTLVPPGWLERLSDAAYAAPDIGTVTPLSNDASILSYPGPAGTNPRPDQAATNQWDRLAARANGSATMDIPVGVGFCLYLRRDCLNAVGAFRADIFAQGYGEENDLCLRARRLGWRNVALTGLFVGHHGGTTFGASATHLRQRNGRLMEQLHPGYGALIEQFAAADPLAETRRRIDLRAWRQRGKKWNQAAILITHNEGGGVERRLDQAIRTHADAGRRPIVLRPAELPDKSAAIAVHDGLSNDFPNLIFAMPGERPALLRLLRAARADRIEAHHLADHPSAIHDLIAQLDIPYTVHVHDYAWFCPRVSLVAGESRYCGEPDLRDCEACVADNGHFLKEDIGVAALRQRSARFFSGAESVVVPADDVAIRLRRHFPTLVPVTVPHEDDSSAIQAASLHARVSPETASRTRPAVCVVGAIGVHKGYDVLLACARDADRRDLDLEFVVVGHTIDDARMIATGRVFVTGLFEPHEAVGLITAQQAQLGFVPSICPETWCLGLGDLWRAGLPAVAFDIGAPAERIRRTGHGIVLPLGLSPNAINNRLLAVIRAAGH